MNYKELNGISIRQGFTEFNKKNPQIYRTFEKQALRAIANGRTKLSAKMIINWIRWETSLTSEELNFKINDAYQSYYPRLFAALNPKHKDVFNYRKLRNEEFGPFVKVGEQGELTFL